MSGTVPVILSMKPRMKLPVNSDCGTKSGHCRPVPEGENGWNKKIFRREVLAIRSLCGTGVAVGC